MLQKEVCLFSYCLEFGFVTMVSEEVKNEHLRNLEGLDHHNVLIEKQKLRLQFQKVNVAFKIKHDFFTRDQNVDSCNDLLTSVFISPIMYTEKYIINIILCLYLFIKVAVLLQSQRNIIQSLTFTKCQGFARIPSDACCLFRYIKTSTITYLQMTWLEHKGYSNYLNTIILLIPPCSSA